MSDPIRVVVDGSDARKPKQRPRGLSVLVAVGVLAGLGFVGLLFVYTSGSEEPLTVSTSIQEASQPTLPRYGVTAVSPEFPDAIVAVVGGSRSNLDGPAAFEHILWPSEAPEVVRPLHQASQPGPSALDVTGTWVVVSSVDPDTSLLELSMGRPSSVKSIGDTVNSFAWHDSMQGRLSYSVVEDGVWELRMVTGVFPSETIPTDIPLKGLGFVASWGDWGWAIQDYGSNSLEPNVWLLDSDGFLTGSLPGIAYGSHPSGLLIVADDPGVSVVRILDGATVAFHERAGNMPIAAASISPDGSKAAFLDFDDLAVIALDDSEIVFRSEPIVGWAQAVWSSDSRFVMVPGPTGVSIIDIVSNTTVEGFAGLAVQSVGIIPLTTS